jgi:hypothetical protein
MFVVTYFCAANGLPEIIGIFTNETAANRVVEERESERGVVTVFGQKERMSFNAGEHRVTEVVADKAKHLGWF